MKNDLDNEVNKKKLEINMHHLHGAMQYRRRPLERFLQN